MKVTIVDHVRGSRTSGEKEKQKLPHTLRGPFSAAGVLRTGGATLYAGGSANDQQRLD